MEACQISNFYPSHNRGNSAELVRSPWGICLVSECQTLGSNPEAGRCPSADAAHVPSGKVPILKRESFRCKNFNKNPPSALGMKVPPTGWWAGVSVAQQDSDLLPDPVWRTPAFGNAFQQTLKRISSVCLSTSLGEKCLSGLVAFVFAVLNVPCAEGPELMATSTLPWGLGCKP